MKTKEKILQTALQLFNERGLAKVTLRVIAGEMGISQGNLNYHFKHRKDIIEALYKELVKKMDQGMGQLVSGLDMTFLFQSNILLFEQLYEYRFLMLDFVQVMREYSSIRTHYQQLQAIRTQQFMYLVKAMQEKGWLREELYDKEYERLYRRMNIGGDFWISFAEIAEGQLTHNRLRDYSILLAEHVFPYLTPEGQRLFLEAKTSLS